MEHLPGRSRSLAVFIVLTTLVCITIRSSRIAPQPANAPIGNGPLRRSPVNPRYFVDALGRTIYLTGAHTWAIFQDFVGAYKGQFDYTRYLDMLHRYNHNALRFWLHEHAVVYSQGVRHVIDPLPWARSNTGRAADGGPKFDLTQFNPAYFNRLYERVRQAHDRGIYVVVTLFDGRAIHGYDRSNKGWDVPSAWSGHPFHPDNNINELDIDRNHHWRGTEIHTLRSRTITDLQKAYVRKVLDTLNSLDNVIYEISHQSPPESRAWQQLMLNYVRTYEASKPRQHPVGLSAFYEAADNLALASDEQKLDWVSYAHIPTDDSQNYKNIVPATTCSRVSILDTSHIWGDAARDSDVAWVWKSFTRGHNPIYLDPNNTRRSDAIMRNLGYTRAFAEHMDLAATTPRASLHSGGADSGYCLANTILDEEEYLIYAPLEQVTVNLRTIAGTLFYEWFDISAGRVVRWGMVAGGDEHTFTQPSKTACVLYIHRTDALFSIPIVAYGC